MWEVHLQWPWSWLMRSGHAGWLQQVRWWICRLFCNCLYTSTCHLGTLSSDLEQVVPCCCNLWPKEVFETMLWQCLMCTTWTHFFWFVYFAVRDPCANNQCYNGGTCIAESCTQFSCRCAGCYTGTNCSLMPLLYCSPKPLLPNESVWEQWILSASQWFLYWLHLPVFRMLDWLHLQYT